MSVKLMLRFLVESEGFGDLDCGATTSFGSVEGVEAKFSKSHEHDTRIPDQPKPTPLMLGMDFLKEQRCVIDYGKDLIQFPMQSDCWWRLFVSSRGLYSMPLCGQHWEPSSRAR